MPVSHTLTLPDVIMENIIATIFDQNGHPKLNISTPKMTYFSAKDVTQLNNPKITVFRKSPTPWIITATKAKAFNGIDKIDLSRNVLAYHPENLQSPATTFKTEQLTLHSASETAETQAPVTFIQPKFTVNGIGLHADLKTGSIHLLSQLRGEYVP